MFDGQTNILCGAISSRSSLVSDSFSNYICLSLSLVLPPNVYNANMHTLKSLFLVYLSDDGISLSLSLLKSILCLDYRPQIEW